MNNTNNMTARDSYNIARSILFNAMVNDKSFGGPDTPRAQREASAWSWVNNRKMSQGEIRLEVQLNTANNQFKFGLTNNQSNTQGVIFNTERRLELQDSLICNEYGIFVGQPTEQTDAAYPLLTHGNQIAFGAADGVQLDSVFYSNGFFSIKVNNDVVLPYRGLFNHWYKPRTQQTAAFGAGSPLDEIRGAVDGMITAEPNILLIGSKGYVPTIELPTALVGTFAFTRVVLIFRGILAQNSTVVS